MDRRHRPGGHWLDAYPFVKLHQPSPCDPVYGWGIVDAAAASC